MESAGRSPPSSYLVEIEPSDSNVKQENTDFISSEAAVTLPEDQSAQWITKVDQMTTNVENDFLVANPTDTDGEGRNVSFITVSSPHLPSE